MHVLFEINNGEQIDEFYFDGSPAEVRRAFLRYARMRHVETVSVWNDNNGLCELHCDNTEPQEVPEDTPCIEWNGFDKPGEY